MKEKRSDINLFRHFIDNLSYKVESIPNNKG